MTSSTICVVTPSFAQATFIERTIRSVLSQGVPGLEYVVCDGGSTDGTIEILSRFQGSLSWRSEPDDGQADAVNKGLARTTAPIIGWLNSDDVYYAGTLAYVVSFFEQHPEVDVLYGDAEHIDEHDRVIEPYYTEDWNFARLQDVCFLCQPAVFFRRRVVERFGPLDRSLRYCMDYEYWLRVGASVPFVRVPRVLAGSRLHAQTKTLGSRVAVHAEINDMLRQRLGVVPVRWLYNYAFAVYDAAGWERRALHRHGWLFFRTMVGACLRWRRSLPPSVPWTVARWLVETWRAARRERALS